MQRLEGKIAAITGGAGGIGKAIGQVFAEAGAQVALIDLDGDRTEVVAAALGGRGFAADVANETDVQDCAAAIRKHFGANADILVNCASILQAPLPPRRLKQERWDAVVEVGLRGTYLCCATFGEAMTQGAGGSIVNIASVGGMISFPYHAYGPAKAGVIALTRSLAAEWGGMGVRVNAVSPGFTLTEQLRDAADRGLTPLDPIVRTTPQGRLVEPREVAEATLFLASPAASAITGVNLPVDCGWLAGVTWEPYGGLRGPASE